MSGSTEGRQAFALAALALVAGCGGATAMREDLDAQRNLHALVGRVAVEEWNGSPIVVALLTSPDAADGPIQLYDYVVLDSPGARFSFLVDPPRRLRIVAYEDTDASTTHEGTERLAFWDDARELTIEGGGRHEALELTIRGPVPSFDLMPETAPPTAESRSLSLGEIASLDEPRFSPEIARVGLYEPLRFMREVGAGVFFEEEFDPARTPVLFVHGISGSPRELAALAEGLDHSRFQAWFAQYPSGFALDLVAEHVDRALDELTVRYRPPAICVVAHSMGGLVMRDALARYGAGRDRARIPLVVTLASPLGGHPGAAMGVALSPVVLPVWRSLDPASEFVTGLYDHALPPESRVALFFAFGTDDARSDGIVPLTSQLRSESEHEAAVVRGFPTSHTGILRDDDARVAVLGELDAHCR